MSAARQPFERRRRRAPARPAAASASACSPCTMRVTSRAKRALRLALLWPVDHRLLLRRDLLLGQPGEVAEVANHVGILLVEPELVEPVGRRPPRIQPDGALFRLAELHPIGAGHQRIDEGVGALAPDAADQLDARDDVAPLVAAARLESAAVLVVELQKVVGLQEHVAELGVRDAILPLQPRLHRVLRHHVVDGEVLADIAQEVHHRNRRQPVGVVDDAGPDCRAPRSRGNAPTAS